MEWAEICTHWDAFAAELQNRWGRLTDEDLHTARSGREHLVQCVIRRYGVAPAIAERHVHDWQKSACLPYRYRQSVATPTASAAGEAAGP